MNYFNTYSSFRPLIDQYKIFTMVIVLLKYLEELLYNNNKIIIIITIIIINNMIDPLSAEIDYA